MCTLGSSTQCIQCDNLMEDRMPNLVSIGVPSSYRPLTMSPTSFTLIDPGTQRCVALYLDGVKEIKEATTKQQISLLLRKLWLQLVQDCQEAGVEGPICGIITYISCSLHKCILSLTNMLVILSISLDRISGSIQQFACLTRTTVKLLPFMLLCCMAKKIVLSTCSREI